MLPGFNRVIFFYIIFFHLAYRKTMISEQQNQSLGLR